MQDGRGGSLMALAISNFPVRIVAMKESTSTCLRLHCRHLMSAVRLVTATSDRTELMGDGQKCFRVMSPRSNFNDSCQTFSSIK